jgi:predicted transcriptional regulator
MPPRQAHEPIMTSIRIPKELAHRLQAVANTHERSIAAEARVALTEYVNKHKAAKAAKR